jgi:hypothetical protein
MPDYDPTNPVSSIRERLSIKRKHRSSLPRPGPEQSNPKLLDQARDVMRRQTEKPNSPLLELALVLVRFDHVA